MRRYRDDGGDWVELAEEQVRELCSLTTRDEAGRHFTEWARHYGALEEAGAVAIHRPVHEPSGISYDPSHWSVEVTDFGREIVEQSEDLWGDPAPTLADRLRRVLDARGCTVAEAARLAGMPRQVVHKIASGANDNPKVRTLEAIVSAIGATLGELFADED